MSRDSQIIIRNAISTDAAEIVQVLAASWLATYVPLGVPVHEIDNSFSNTKQKVTKLYSYLQKIDHSKDIGIVAVLDEKIVGLCFGTSTHKIYTLTQLYVHPDWIGQGIGSTLLLYFIEQTSGLPITLTVFVKNLSAISFYKSHGFLESSVVNQYKLNNVFIMNEIPLTRRS